MTAVANQTQSSSCFEVHPLDRRGLALGGCQVFLPMAHRREPAAKGRGIRLRNAEDLQAEGSTVEPAGTEALARDG